MRLPTLLNIRWALLIACVTTGCFITADAQKSKKPAAVPAASTPASDPAAVDAPAPKPAAFAQVKSDAEYEADAWKALTDALADAKNATARTQALAGLGLLGSNARALELIRTALADSDADIRLAAVLAAGETKSPALLASLHTTLADSEAPVAFAAARILAKSKDPAGQNILLAVSRGNAGSKPGMFDTVKQGVSGGLRHAGELVKSGAKQSADFVLGPFGMGPSAMDAIQKLGGDPVRMAAVQSLGEYRSAPVRDQLIALLADKDAGVRAMSAKELAVYPEPQVSTALTHLFDDPRLPVKLTASAAWLAVKSSMPAPAAPGASLKINRAKRPK